MPECIHGLELASCDACSPKPRVRVEPVEAKRRIVKTPAVRSVKVSAPTRLHVVLSFGDIADVLADGEIVDPIYFYGPEELAWTERRRAADALDQVVLVVPSAAVAGLDTLPLSAVQLIAVANIVAQERVRELLALTELRAKVSVHPPWFSAELA